MEFLHPASQSLAALLTTSLKMVFAKSARPVAALVKEVTSVIVVTLDSFIGGVTEDIVVTLNASCSCPIG
jgi:hypothetical protein